MILKGKIPFLYGGQPPYPRDLTLYEQKHVKQGQCKKHCPHASVTSFGAQVASQQGLILQTGKVRIA
jgi:hypothetical protein